MEYFFCDTGAELPETYEYLDRLETALGKPIARLNATKGLRPLVRGLPRRTALPHHALVHQEDEDRADRGVDRDDEAVSYVAIRADESGRKGYVSTKPNIHAVFPFVEDGIDHDGVMRILEEAGIGLPSYYEWRTRSGCYFCFYQRKAEWVGLAERHPDLFERAIAIENKVMRRPAPMAMHHSMSTP